LPDTELSKEFDILKRFVVECKDYHSDRLNNTIDKLDKKINGISWAMVFVLTFVYLFGILNFKGCDTKQEIKPPPDNTVVTLTMDALSYGGHLRPFMPPL